MSAPGRALLTALVCTFAFATTFADPVYRWVDKDGKVHFSDKPKDAPGATATKTRNWVDVRGHKSYSDRSPDQIKADRRRFARRMECMTGLTEIIETPKSPSYRKVILLTARWCGLSVQARHWLKQHRIAFREYDIDRDRRGRSLYLGLARKGIPVLLVGRQQMFGFRADLADTLLRENGHYANKKK